MFKTIIDFLERRDMRKIRKFWNKHMNEKYTEEYQKVLNAQFKKDAQQILDKVLKPYFEEMEATHGGLKKIQVTINTWGNEDYEIYSNADPVLKEYQYPTSTRDFNGVWLALVDLCQNGDIEGKGEIDEDGFIQFYFLKKLA